MRYGLPARRPWLEWGQSSSREMGLALGRWGDHYPLYPVFNPDASISFRGLHSLDPYEVFQSPEAPVKTTKLTLKLKFATKDLKSYGNRIRPDASLGWLCSLAPGPANACLKHEEKQLGKNAGFGVKQSWDQISAHLSQELVLWPRASYVPFLSPCMIRKLKQRSCYLRPPDEAGCLIGSF